MTSAIVVLNYNDADLTMRYTDKIRHYSTYDYVIVVDNASTDGKTETLRKFCEDNGIDFVESKENKGYSYGNNLGAFHAIRKYDPDFIFISNPDIICSEDSAKKIIEGFSVSDDIGLVTGLIHVYDDNHEVTEYPYFSYRVPSLADMISNCLLICTKVKMRVLDKSMYYEASEVKEKGRIYVGAVSGCFFAIRSEAFTAINGFDEDVFLYNEEAILGYKLRNAGYKEMVVDALVIHDENKDKRKGIKKQWTTHKRIQKSALIYLDKYLNANAGTKGLYVALNTFGFAERYLLSLIRPGR